MATIRVTKEQDQEAKRWGIRNAWDNVKEAAGELRERFSELWHAVWRSTGAYEYEKIDQDPIFQAESQRLEEAFQVRRLRERSWFSTLPTAPFPSGMGEPFEASKQKDTPCS
jgi:hypothetical protein